MNRRKMREKTIDYYNWHKGFRERELDLAKQRFQLDLIRTGLHPESADYHKAFRKEVKEIIHEIYEKEKEATK